LYDISVGVHRGATNHRLTGGKGTTGNRKSDHGSGAEQFDLHDEGSFWCLAAGLGLPWPVRRRTFPLRAQASIGCSLVHPFSYQAGNPFEWPY
jgi:hypothetical protein